MPWKGFRQGLQRQNWKTNRKKRAVGGGLPETDDIILGIAWLLHEV